MRTATRADGLTAGAGPFSGEVRLAAGPGPAAVARGVFGERRLVVLVGEAAWGSAATARTPGRGTGGRRLAGGGAD